MSFGAPGYLALLVVAALAALALASWAFWRASARARLGTAAPRALATYVAGALMVAAIAFAAVAAARPQAGHHETTVEQEGIDLMIVLDVSHSMFADDVAPSRLGRAQEEIALLLDRMTGDRAGLVIFAAEPFLRSPLTLDLAALRGIVAGVHEERGLVLPGSDLGTAIERAQVALLSGAADTKVMLIVSDGEDHGGGIAPAVASARASGIRVYTAGAGTAEGAAVVDFDPASGTLRPRIGEGGVPVITRLDAAALTQIADGAGGRYVDLSADAAALPALSAEFDNLASTTFAREETATPIERFQIFAAIALALAVLAMLVTAVRLPASRAVMRIWPLAGAAVFIAGICAADAADINRRGNRQYAAGDYQASVDSYRTAQALDASQRELYHNAGNALDQLGEYISAIDETKRALADDPSDDALKAAVEYALGGHYAGAEQLQEALEAYKRSLLADPDDVDAKHNLEVIIRRLTPTTTPTPALTPPLPEQTPTPGGPDDPTQPQGTPGAGTPVAGGTPGPADPSDIPPDQLDRLLEEALAGIDDEFTVEEAIRVLQLIEQQNRDRLEERAGVPGLLPDY